MRKLKLTAHEQFVADVVMEETWHTITKFDDEGDVYYELRDGCGDLDGDPIYDWYALVDYVCNCDEVDKRLAHAMMKGIIPYSVCEEPQYVEPPYDDPLITNYMSPVYM
jgi:hypothetical protein